jgi:phospholipid/cholesterol/gamma-HCH transport system ATP-binding protein
MTATPEIELRGIRFVRGGYEVLRDLSLSLERGETLFAMGEAGSGKSVLLKIAAGIALPAEGEVLYKGRSLEQMSAKEEAVFRKASGFVFQDGALWANASLFDNLALPVRLHEPRWGKAEVERAVRRAAELVGFDHDLKVRPAELSSGERKLIGLARALVLDPELLFMDDPTSNLDEASATRVPEIVEALKRRGCSIFVTSAVSEFVTRCADSVAVLISGSLAARGSYEEAEGWTDEGVRAVTGRLKPRAPKDAAWMGGLEGAWVSAFAEDPSIVELDSASKPSGEMSALGDIINDLGGDESEGGNKDTT